MTEKQQILPQNVYLSDLSNNFLNVNITNLSMFIVSMVSNATKEYFQKYQSYSFIFEFKTIKSILQQWILR